MLDPYRTQAEMPESKEPMDDKVMFTKIWTRVALGIVLSVTSIVTGNVITSIHANQTSIEHARYNPTPSQVELAQSKAIEAKALADKAMYEGMSKTQK